VSPVGLYALLPLPLGLALRRAFEGRRSKLAPERERAALLWFLLFQIAFVVAVSSAFSSQESSRYRYQIEPFLWLLTATALGEAWQKRPRPRSA
jgi:peptidoglycan/LPS O-acetylase OafA/YrhL